MNDGLVTFREGTTLAPQLTVRAWNAMVAAIRRNWITAGPNIQMQQGPGGTQVWGGRVSRSRAAQVIRTFFTYDVSSGATKKVRVTSGAINNEVWEDTEDDEFTVIDGDKVYIHVEVDGDGVVTAIGCGVGSSIPDSTITDGYTLLATISIIDDAMIITPVAWNYSQMQKCGSTTYLWGGFGE